MSSRGRGPWIEAAVFVDVILAMEGKCCCGRKEGHMGWIECVLQETKKRLTTLGVDRVGGVNE